MKKLFALILALVMVCCLAACGNTADTQTTPDAGETTESTAALMKFTVIVVHADGTSKEFTYETDEEFVGPVLEAAGLIVGEEGPYGLTITEVDGETAVYETDKAYWALYEGEEYALQGIDTTPVTDGGVYKLVYTGA